MKSVLNTVMREKIV